MKNPAYNESARQYPARTAPCRPEIELLPERAKVPRLITVNLRPYWPRALSVSAIPEAIIDNCNCDA